MTRDDMQKIVTAAYMAGRESAKLTTHNLTTHNKDDIAGDIEDITGRAMDLVDAYVGISIIHKRLEGWGTINEV